MTANRSKTRSGFTLVELMVTLLITSIMGLALGAVVVHGQISWTRMYDGLNGDVATDGHVAKSKFDAVIRNASRGMSLINSDGAWLEITYYADDESTEADRYGRFYTEEGSLKYQYGQLDPREQLGVETICANVSYCVFNQIGGAAHMILTLDDGTHEKTVVSSAISYNE